jgi:hypothetical protein
MNTCRICQGEYDPHDIPPWKRKYMKCTTCMEMNLDKWLITTDI